MRGKVIRISYFLQTNSVRGEEGPEDTHVSSWSDDHCQVFDCDFGKDQPLDINYGKVAPLGRDSGVDPPLDVIPGRIHCWFMILGRIHHWILTVIRSDLI